MNAFRLIVLCCGWWPILGFSMTRDYLIDAWQTDEGLPNNAVTAIVQSRDGYLWIGTSNGLARFDGVRFTTFRTVDTPELGSNLILCLYEDKEGVLWIGTDGGGLTRYERGRFLERSTKEGLASPAVLCACEDNDRQLWVGTPSGLNRWDQTRFISFFESEGLRDDRVNTMALLPSGKLILGTGKGLAELKTARFTSYESVDHLPHGDIRLLLADRTGCLWLADESGLWRINLQSPSEDSQAYHGLVTSLAQDANGAIWFGTAAGGLRQIVGGAQSYASVEVEHFSSAITVLREDREGSLWLGTANDGLRRLKPPPLRLTALPQSLAKREVSSLLRTSTGAVWLASSAGTLNLWQDDDPSPLESPRLPEDAFVDALCGDTKSGLWIGTRGNGLFHWKDDQLLHFSQRDGLSDSDIETLCCDGHDGIWLGTRNGGLNHLQNGRITRLLTPWGFTGNFANTMAQDKSEQLWIGTSGDGLFRMSNSVFSVYTTKNGLPSDQVNVLLADDDGAMWVGTASGLVRFKDENLTTFNAKNGLPEDEVYQLQGDGDGNLWVGCNRGIYRLRKTQLRNYAQRQTRFIDAIEYGKQDGLPGLQCLPHAAVVNNDRLDETLWFLTSKGLAAISNRKPRWNPLPPPVILEQVLLGNESLSLSEPVRVPPGENKIQFQYTALSLIAPEKVRFRCQLAGFDPDWVEEGGSRRAIYTKVPSGHYQFRVLACNNDGVWNETGASLAFVVVPFWWDSKLFRLAMLALVGSVAFGLHWLGRARLREIEQLRVRVAGDLHDELGSSLWSISLLSNMLQKHGQMGEEERRDLGEIHRIATQTSNAIRDIVWLINPTFDTMQDLVLRMKDSAGTILRGVEWQLHCEGLDLSHQLTLEFRHNLFLSFKEALTNIAKHAQASTVEIRLKEQPGLAILTISDNGIGFTPSVGAKGFGLKSMQRRLEKIGGTIRIDSEISKGTTIIFTIARRGRLSH
jgi:ligand-binding sensor domain-containing protein